MLVDDVAADVPAVFGIPAGLVDLAGAVAQAD